MWVLLVILLLGVAKVAKKLRVDSLERVVLVGGSLLDSVLVGFARLIVRCVIL